MSFTICVNTVGHLPEMEPYKVDTLQEARDALRTEINRTIDAHDGPGAEEYGAQEAEALQAVSELPEHGGCIAVGKYVHSATPEGRMYPAPNGWRR